MLWRRGTAALPRAASSQTMSTVRPQHSSEVYQHHSPPFHRTRRTDLESQWGGLGFNIRPMNGHVSHTWSDGSWDEGMFVPSPYQLLHINAGALHYGISCFEGMKAFACADGAVRITRPDLNAERMKRGAEALLMPAVPEDIFINAVKEAVTRNREFIPPYGHGAAMYIRPLLFASGPMLVPVPLTSEYTFFVTVMPTGALFAPCEVTGAEVGVKALVSENHDRAAPRGTGAIKAAGNYAADMKPVHDAHRAGYNTTLYLDACEQRYLEEFSVANFVGITHDGTYVTPKSHTILASTTNMLLMDIARERGMAVEERPVDFEAEITNFKEVGMCGTAAVLVKVDSITRGNTTYEFKSFNTLGSLRSALTSVQCGDAPDELGFMTEVCDVFDPDNDLPACDSHYASAGMLSAVGLRDGLEQPAAPPIRKLLPSRRANGDSNAAHQTTWYNGHERELLDWVVQKAQSGDPESILQVMDEFWESKFPRLRQKYSARWQRRNGAIEEKMVEMAKRSVSSGRPLRCLGLGTYCGYSTIKMASLLPQDAVLVSVEDDTLFAAVATKIVEFAGLDNQTKIWMGSVDVEWARVRSILREEPADVVLFDHSRERYVEDLRLLEDVGIVGKDSEVMFDLGVYTGDDIVTHKARTEIRDFFMDRSFAVATML